MAEKPQCVSHIDGFISIDFTIDNFRNVSKSYKNDNNFSTDNSTHIFHTVLGFNEEAPNEKYYTKPYTVHSFVTIKIATDTSEYKAEEKLKVLNWKGDTYKAYVVRYNHIKLILLFGVCYAVQSCY